MPPARPAAPVQLCTARARPPDHPLTRSPPSLQAPFGDDMMDVDFNKVLRRLDKHTAAQLAAAYPLVDGELKPVVNFDLYPETASTDNAHADTDRARTQANIYRLEAARNEKPASSPIPKLFTRESSSMQPFS